MSLVGPPQRPAWPLVAQEHEAAISRYIRSRVWDSEVVKDLTQETLARATKSWPTYKPERAEPIRWLLVIARRVIADHLERESRRKSAEDAWKRLEPDAEHAAEPGWDSEVAAAFGHLTEDDQTLLWLYVIQKLPSKDVAAQLGIKRSTASMRARRALERLHEALDKGNPHA